MAAKGTRTKSRKKAGKKGSQSARKLARRTKATKTTPETKLRKRLAAKSASASKAASKASASKAAGKTGSVGKGPKGSKRKDASRKTKRAAARTKKCIKTPIKSRIAKSGKAAKKTVGKASKSSARTGGRKVSSRKTLLSKVLARKTLAGRAAPSSPKNPSPKAPSLKSAATSGARPAIGSSAKPAARGGASRRADKASQHAMTGVSRPLPSSRTARGRSADAPRRSRTGAPRTSRAHDPTRQRLSGVSIRGVMAERYDEILSPAALGFLAQLHRKFDKRRRRLLQARADRQKRFDAGELPDFLPETQAIRDGDWTVGPIPPDLNDRRVEITGPVDRKMIVNALNSGATDYMADFEDANSPLWSNNVEGQINLRDLWAGAIAFTDPDSGKHYAVNENKTVLILRPRGWHLPEDHLVIDGKPMSGALFDFGLYVFHNARAILDVGSAPYFYLPKLESHREARLWNDVFLFAQQKLRIPPGTFKATVLIETLPAAFEMDEILHALREHIVGLNAGRWDYIFSFIKTFAKSPDFVLPDRGQVVMGEAFLGAYAALLVKTCHRRGAFAMGGMAAQIPIKNDAAANDAAFAKVRADKEREVRECHDGTWVAHPDLVPVAKEVFDRLMPTANQLGVLREDVVVTRDDLLRIHDGTKTEEGFRLNIRVGVQYIEAWLRGHGAVPIYHLMEDAATAEISRAQIWQWLTYGAVLDTGVTMTPTFFETALAEEMARVREEVGADAFEGGRFPDAIDLLRTLSLSPDCAGFLTLPAYKILLRTP